MQHYTQMHNWLEQTVSTLFWILKHMGWSVGELIRRQADSETAREFIPTVPETRHTTGSENVGSTYMGLTHKPLVMDSQSFGTMLAVLTTTRIPFLANSSINFVWCVPAK